MSQASPRKCPLCGAELKKDSDACPSCGTDTALLDLEKDETIEKVKDSKSIDDLLASVLGGWSPGQKSTTKDEALEDLDLDLPEEPQDAPKLELDLLEEDVLGGDEETGMTFECPSCGMQVDESASHCPSCGAVFAEGDTFECPVCGEEVAVDSSQCPKCGVRFMEEGVEDVSAEADKTVGGEIETIDPSLGLERLPGRPAKEEVIAEGETGDIVKAVMELYRVESRENPLLVGDKTNLQASLHEEVKRLKSLVALAKQLKVPTDQTQRSIAQATKRARARDIEGAVKLAWGARVALEQSVAIQVAQRIELLKKEVGVHRSKGHPFPVAETLIREAIEELQARRPESAHEKLMLAREDVASRSSGQSEARYALQAAEEMLQEVSELGVRVEPIREIVSKGRRALRNGDWEMAFQLASKAQEAATGSIREGLAAEMKRAKKVVMELKIQGRDISQPIELLKQASASIKENDYAGALRYLKLFKTQLRTT